MTLAKNNTLPVNFGTIKTEISILNYLNIHISMRDIFRITRWWLEITGDLSSYPVKPLNDKGHVWVFFTVNYKTTCPF